MHSSPSPRRTPARRGRSPRSLSLSSPTAHVPPEFSLNKTSATFTSCLSIAVQGAVPVDRQDAPSSAVESSATAAPLTPNGELKRPLRKSKATALEALHNHAQSSMGQEDMNDPSNEDVGIRIQLRDGPPIQVPSVLDMSSVKTPFPRKTASPVAQRAFGLTDCPTFYPTPEQFKDPMAYIRSVSDAGKAYGMCKIVPPQGWDMPFVTDTERFRFKTRLQRLNSIEASSRAKVNFLEQLYRFHKQQGNPRVSVPTINHKPLDLWLLRKEVHKLGGFEAVTKAKKWADLGRLLGYTGIPGLSTQMKNSYARVILPFEHFHERVRNSPSMSPNKTYDAQLKTHTNIQSPVSSSAATKHARTGSSGGAGGDVESPPSSPLTATSSPLSEPPEDGDYKDSNGLKTESARPRRSTRHGSQEQITPARRASGADMTAAAKTANRISGEKEGVAVSEPHCEVCQKKNHGEEMLLCDGCDCGFHMFCLDPPLTAVPKGQWFCHTCLFGTGGDFGFDEGEEHSLSSFQARDLEFRRLWFKSHPPSRVNAVADEDDKMSDEVRASKYRSDDPSVNRFDDVVVTEADVENEFWRLVQSPTETVEVEYGADVHSTTHGSGMPTLETHPLDPYSKDPWNLNNVPILSDSLLRFIKSDISGMTVPWTYVGMVFSTFCWHNEDHYTYSVNYMHWGETKTWYSIPGEDADKFEAAIRGEAPDLFEAQPDLLFQLVTLMNPGRLKEGGVDVYACNQRAGEFVITFPKAYHAGFNHGLNFNEAVNFALPDWLPYGLDCVKRYQEHRKLPVFSHDEMLITITQQSQTIKTAIWLNDSLQEMTEREMQTREKARSLNMTETLEEADRPEEQYQCSVCKVFCYLSQIACHCTPKIACIDHADLLCKCPKHSRVLRKRFSDAELQDITAKVAERAAVPSVWRAKLNKLLAESARPPLRSLRALLAEGDRINYPFVELHALRKCVARANEWVDLANSFTTRKPSRKRPRRSRGRPSTDGASAGSVTDDMVERPDRGLDDVYALLKEVESLGFDSPELAALKAVANEAEEVQLKARNLLEAIPSSRDRDAYIQECERLILQGSSLNVCVDELMEIEKIVMRQQLIKQLDEELDDDSLTLEDIRHFVARAHLCDLGAEGGYLKRLESLQRAGDQWEERVRDILSKPQRTMEELDEFAKPSDVPIDPDLYERILGVRARAKDIEKQARTWLAPELGGVKPKVQDVVKLAGRAEKEFNIPAVTDLKRTVDFAVDLETRCEAVLKGRYKHLDEDTDIFTTMRQWRSYAKEHLTMFTLPNFEKLDKQLAQHFRWLEALPWYCRQHQESHGRAVLDDVVESTKPEDDLPPNDEYFTCICTSSVRPPAPGTISDAVQCDHCFARFHGVCAANGGSCPFCDHHHWNGTIHKERSWHFCYLPTMLANAPDVTKNYSDDWKQLEVIVHRVDRLSGVIGQFLTFASQSVNQRPEYIPQVRHYMRKLYRIQFAVSPNPEVSFGLDLAGLHRILACQPAPVRLKKRRRPKFVFGQDVDKDWIDGTRCICRGRTSYLLNYPKVECDLCGKFYHGGCVFFPIPEQQQMPRRFICPLCCLRKNRVYPFSDVRVKHIENADPDIYVDTKEMLDTFSKDIIYLRLPPPYTQTLFVELIRFTPGQPDNIVAGAANGSATPHPSAAIPSYPSMSNGSTPQSRPPSHGPRSSSHSNGHGHHGHTHSHSHSHGLGHGHGPMSNNAIKSTSPIVPYERGRSSGAPSHHVPPPPPWTSTSRWSNAAVAAAPPTARTHAGPEPPLRSPLHTPPQSSRKRKYPDDGVPQHDERSTVSLITPPMQNSPKRHHSSHTPQPTPRSNQGLSPSLAMIMSPNSTDPRSPHPHQMHGSSYGPPQSQPPRAPSSRMYEDGQPSSRKAKPPSRPDDDRWGSHAGPAPLQTIDLRTRTPPPRH